jgi:hypothetical protein
MKKSIPLVNTSQSNINLSIQTEKDKSLNTRAKFKPLQLILLYLKFHSTNINFNDFSFHYFIKFDVYNHYINTLYKQNIISELKRRKRNTTSKNYKLNIEPEKIIVFPFATEQEHQQVYKYLQNNILSTATNNNNNNDDLENIVNIIVNPQALKLLHELQNSETTTFHFSKKSKALNHLIKFNAVKKLKIKTYTLTENYNQELYKSEQQKLFKNTKQQIISPNFNKDINFLKWIIDNTNWLKTHNTHNQSLNTKVKGLYDDISTHRDYSLIGIDDKNDGGHLSLIHKTNQNAQLRPIHIKVNSNTLATAVIHKDDTLSITIGCSKNPILVDDTIRLNFILLQVLEELNNTSPVANRLNIQNYYKCNYDSFTVAKHDFALDGSIPYSLPEGLEISFINQNGEKLMFYVKKSYKNHSWIRIEDRANNDKYSLPEFRTMIQNRILNLIPLTLLP